MNEFDQSKIEKLLKETAEKTNPNLMFVAELEQTLKKSHRPRRSFSLPSIHSILPVLGRVGVVALLAFIMIWFFKSNQPPMGAENPDFICPVTPPNGSVPPGEEGADPNYYGNGKIWTYLEPGGIYYRRPDNYDPGANEPINYKWWWWREANVPLTIEGHRLDADAESLVVEIPEGYADYFQVATLRFPTLGCWEVTAHAGEASLTFVINIVFDEATLEPAPVVVEDTPIVVSTPQGEAYTWFDQTVYLNASLPDTPTEMKVYLANSMAPATAESARALASQLGMDGRIYEAPGNMPGATGYIVVDGNQHLRIYSGTYFSYYPDYTQSTNSTSAIGLQDAESQIRDFMQNHGFDFEYKVEWSEFLGTYAAIPVTPDGFPIHHDHFGLSGLVFHFNDAGIAFVDTSLLPHDEVATVTIISAEEAFQKFLDPNTVNGMTMGMHSPGTTFDTWVRPREFNTDQSITYYGYMNTTGRSLDGNDPLIMLDGYPVTGNTSTIEENLQNIYVEAVGKFIETDGYKTFELETWNMYNAYEEAYQGSIQRQGGQVVMLTTEGNTLILPDVPESLQLPAEDMFIVGVTSGDVFEWKSIDNRSMAGGGGGGGGPAFYKLNLSGPPVPFPTATAVVAQQPAEPIVFDGLRGTLSITVIKRGDGTEQTQYGMISSDEYGNQNFFTLKGSGLEPLLAYQMMPVTVWGVTDEAEGVSIINVERYEIPYPDLQFQILKGTQKTVDLNGQTVILFTTEAGQSYIQSNPNGDLDFSTIGTEGDLVVVEALAIPDETFSGYRTIRVFSSAMALNPKNNETIELSITANEPFIMAENPTGNEVGLPTLTIEKVELIYFTPDQRYAVPDPNAEPPYLQPVWRFSGHYNDGSEFEFLIQALKQEYLLPEVQQGVPPG